MIRTLTTLAFSLFSVGAVAATGTCDVDRVFAGPNGAVVSKLIACQGFSRTELELTLRYSPGRTVYYNTLQDIQNLQDIVVDATDVLAMKQTLELAKLHSRKIRLQLSNNNAIEWLSID